MMIIEGVKQSLLRKQKYTSPTVMMCRSALELTFKFTIIS